MAGALDRLFAEAQRHMPALRGHVASEWGHAHPGFRRMIRDSIAQTLPELTAGDISALANLDEPPRLERWSVSISHSTKMGGWTAVRRPAQVGWDMELRARIRREIVERVCSADEVQNAPRFEYLWPAKEAFFKALEDEQPLVISEVKIDQWTKLGPELWRWRGLGPRNADGFLLDTGEFLGAISFFP